MSNDTVSPGLLRKNGCSLANCAQSEAIKSWPRTSRAISVTDLSATVAYRGKGYINVDREWVPSPAFVATGESEYGADAAIRLIGQRFSRDRFMGVLSQRFASQLSKLIFVAQDENSRLSQHSPEEMIVVLAQ